MTYFFFYSKTGTSKGAAGMGKKLRVVEKRKRAKKNIKRKKQEKNKKTSLR